MRDWVSVLSVLIRRLPGCDGGARFEGIRLALCLLALIPGRAHAQEAFDCVVYGGTPGAVTAAVAAARQGERVALVSPDKHLGGVVSGGLTYTDIGKVETVGGLAREFFGRVRAFYAKTYGDDSPQVQASRGGIFFEPHVAEEQFAALLAGEANVRVFPELRLAGVRREGARIVALAVTDPAGKRREFRAPLFVDGSYEGDLTAAAGVRYHVGREGREVYGEPHAGQRFGPPEEIGRGDAHVQAYNYRLCLTDRPDLRVLPERPANYDPERYAVLKEYLQTARPVRVDRNALNLAPLPNGKYDANNGEYPWQSTDWVGHSDAYPEATPEERERIRREHLEYVQGLLYFLQNDPGVPEDLRQDALRYGLPGDEFPDTGHWPNHMYVREARRMVGVHVFTEKDATDDPYKPDGIAIGSYTLDSHGCSFVQREGKRPAIEGGLGVRVNPYEIPYGVLVPREVENLLVPVACSGSHVGYSTLRMEPVYMMLGHAAGVAAHLARAAGVPVQRLDVQQLRARLREQGQLLDAPFVPLAAIAWTPERPAAGETVTLSAKEIRRRAPFARFRWDLDGDGTVDSEAATPTTVYRADKAYSIGLLLEDAEGNAAPPVYAELGVGTGGHADVTVDDPAATYSGRWEKGWSIPPFFGEGYRHDANADKGKACRFTPDLPEAGRYKVCVAFAAHENRSGGVPVTVYHAGGAERLALDQRTRPTAFPFAALGTWEFPAGKNRDAGSVLFETRGTEGYVSVDAVRFVRVLDAP